MRWIVRRGDGATVQQVLQRLGADALAVREGRVFIGPRRVRREDEGVREGDEVIVASARATKPDVSILVKTRDLVAADKPAGIPTIADHGGSAHALVALVARALGVEASRLHPTSRLDRDVSGVVFFALTAEARARLSEARATGVYGRRYLAVASAAPRPDRGSWDAPIGRARDPRLRAVGGRDAAASLTGYATCAVADGGQALLAVAPRTGRTHQIRVHGAHAGCALLGDRSYGGPARITLPSGRVLPSPRLDVHARRVVGPGDAGEPLVATSPIPAELTELWSALGGSPDAWEVASSCELP